MAPKQQTLKQKIVSYYLFAYNVAMFLVHYFCFVDLVNETKKGTYNYINHVGSFRVATAFQLLDVVHGYFGITATSVKTGLIQVFGRLFMLTVVVDVKDLHQHYIVLVMLYAYVLIELIRYPYYALQSLNGGWWPITWLRYNAWIVLQPVGISTEFLTLLACFYSHYHKETYNKYLCECLRSHRWVQVAIFAVFIGVLFPFLGYTLISHMYAARKKKYGRLPSLSKYFNFKKFKIY